MHKIARVCVCVCMSIRVCFVLLTISSAQIIQNISAIGTPQPKIHYFNGGFVLSRCVKALNIKLVQATKTYTQQHHHRPL